MPAKRPAARTLALLVAVVLAVAFWLWLAFSPRDEVALGSEPPGLRALCSRCHGWTGPELLPRSAWRGKIEKMFDIGNAGGAWLDGVGLEAAVAWYEQQAPELLPMPEDAHQVAAPGRFRGRSLRLPGLPSDPAVANVRPVQLVEDGPVELLMCDMRHGVVAAVHPGRGRGYRRLATLPHPARAEVVDLDRDGRRDLVVADLGTMVPSDELHGQVVWLRGGDDQGYETVVLASGLGRVADVRAADLDGDGDHDLIVAVFGWIKVGDLRILWNVAEAGESPRFEATLVESKPGVIHVLPADLNADGRLDFVSIVSQHHEQVVAWLNRGGRKFESRVLFVAPHPDWGMSGGELVDLDCDGDLDVLFTNGDTLDDGTVIYKPHHGIRWLENQGDLVFEPRELASFYGVHRAEAADLDGDGDLDVAACAFLPYLRRQTGAAPRGVMSMAWFERTDGGWLTHVLETDACDHATLAIADLDADGDPDLFTGNFIFSAGKWDRPLPWLSRWENVGD